MQINTYIHTHTHRYLQQCSIKSWMTINKKWLDYSVQCWQLFQMSAIKFNPVNIITTELSCT